MKIYLKLNSALRGHNAGDIIAIEADNSGVPADRYWRRRIIDAVIDKCVEVVEKVDRSVVKIDNPKKSEVKNGRRNSNS